VSWTLQTKVVLLAAALDSLAQRIDIFQTKAFSNELFGLKRRRTRPLARAAFLRLCNSFAPVLGIGARLA
jgi:hypothetical protein